MADFRHYYGLSLPEHLRKRGSNGGLPARELGDLFEHLPRGARVWQELGGAKAITAEQEAMWLVEFQIRGVWHAYNGGKGEKPKPLSYPKGNLAAKQEREATERKFASRSTKWARKQAEREAALAALEAHGDPTDAVVLSDGTPD